MCNTTYGSRRVAVSSVLAEAGMDLKLEVITDSTANFGMQGEHGTWT